MKPYLLLTIIYSMTLYAVEHRLDYNITELGFNQETFCPIDVISNSLTIEQREKLIIQRKIIKNDIIQNFNRDDRDILYVPVVFHNLYKIVNDEPVASYCDYDGGFSINNFEYTSDNDQDICNQRMLRSLEVLNANYSPSNIEFILHPEYPEMLHATDPGFDGFYERASEGTETSPSAGDLKEHYNIPKALNIYIVDFVNTQDGTLGISTYPWSYGVLGGIFIKHGQSPGDVDVQPQADYGNVLMHEIGHYFSLLHINGIWYLMIGNTPRELVSEVECNELGDFICDTPAEPGMSNNSWYTNGSTRECIYYGYNGEYNFDDSTISIGGINQTYSNGYYPFYNYCEEWEIEDPYDLDHCQLFTNYDNEGDFFGTKALPDFCYNPNQSEFSTDCHISYYTNLPIGYNFMRAGSFPYNNCGVSPINDNIFFDESKQGFTLEQFENIRYSLEIDYSGCVYLESDNYSEYFLIGNAEDCIFSGYHSGDANLDGNIDVLDVLSIISYILGSNEFSDLQINLSDNNFDSIINIFDIILLVENILAD